MNKFETFKTVFFLLTALANTACEASSSNTKEKPIHGGVEQLNVKDYEVSKSLDAWRKSQNSLPDNKRSLTAYLGKDLLIEKDKGLRIGLHETKQGKALVKLKVTDNNSSNSFQIGSRQACDEMSFTVIENTPPFTFLVLSCSAEKNGEDQSIHKYIVYDKQHKALFDIPNTPNRYSKKGPKLNWNNGVYHYSWQYKDGNETTSNMYYTFKLKSDEEATCTQSWDDDCPFPGNFKKTVD